MRASSKCRTPAFLSENVSSSELTALANVRSYGAIQKCADSTGQHSLQVITCCPTIYHTVVNRQYSKCKKGSKMLYNIILAILACCGAALVLAITIFAIIGIIITGYSIIEYTIEERKNK